MKKITKRPIKPLATKPLDFKIINENYIRAHSLNIQ